MNSTNSSQDDKYTCKICQSVMLEPMIISSCNHILCNNCLQSIIKNSHEKKKCPFCNTNFNKNNIVLDESLQNEIVSVKKTCECKRDVPIIEWEIHTAKCKSYQEEINKNIKGTVVKDAKMGVNRSTFNCPLCPEKNLDRDSLLKHVSKHHKNDMAVCPICLVQPWADPNYKTHLHGHLQKRHKFDYDTTVDYNEDEDEVLRKVLEESMKQK